MGELTDDRRTIESCNMTSATKVYYDIQEFGLRISAVMLSGRTINVEADMWVDTIMDVKWLIFQESGFDPSVHRLIKDSAELENERKLSSVAFDGDQLDCHLELSLVLVPPTDAE